MRSGEQVWKLHDTYPQGIRNGAGGVWDCVVRSCLALASTYVVQSQSLENGLLPMD